MPNLIHIQLNDYILYKKTKQIITRQEVRFEHTHSLSSRNIQCSACLYLFMTVVYINIFVCHNLALYTDGSPHIDKTAPEDWDQ